MKRFVMLLTVMFMCCMMQAQSIVVFGFNAGTGVPETFADSVTSVFIANFHPKDYEIVDSLGVDLTKQQKLATARQMEASRMVMADISLVEEKFVVLVSAVNVTTAETETKFKATLSGIIESERIIIDLATRIAAKIDMITAEEREEEDRTRTMPKSFTVNGVTFEMIYVEGGTFKMGATEEQGNDAYETEKPVHKILLDDYYIGKFEVTQGLWKAVMGSEVTEGGGWKGYGYGDDYPAYRVSWKDCQDFIKKLNELTGENFRLPYEAEWEYAARGGKNSEGHKYSGSNVVNDVAWYTSNTYDSGTQPVGTKNPNELGVYDMSGNVWEWCMDWYGPYESKAIKNPKGKANGNNKVLRGGSWSRGAKLCRVASRGYNLPDARYSYNGFRLVLVIEKTEAEKEN